MEPPFATAMATGDVSCVKTFFMFHEAQEKSSPDAWLSGPDARHALLGAVENDQFEVLQWFVDAQHVDVMGVALASFLPKLLKKAVKCGHVGIVDLLLSSTVFVDMVAAEDKPRLLAHALFTSLRHGAIKIIDVLVAHGGCADLMLCELQRSEDDVAYNGVNCVGALASHGVVFVGADVRLSDAIEANDEQVVKALVHQGVDMDSESLGRTLRYAVREALVELVERLLKTTSFDVDAVDDYGRSALMMVAWQSDVELGSYRHHPEQICTLLLEYGADVNRQDSWGSTPLHHACRSDLPEVVSILLDNGADPTTRSRAGLNPRDEINANQTIMYEETAEIMRRFVERGANLQTKN